MMTPAAYAARKRAYRLAKCHFLSIVGISWAYKKTFTGAGVIITTTDPITGEDLNNVDSKPFVIEGEGHLAVKIYFESEETRRRYLDIEVEHPGLDFVYNLDNPDPNMADFN